MPDSVVDEVENTLLIIGTQREKPWYDNNQKKNGPEGI
jgi:hypothetical protein